MYYGIDIGGTKIELAAFNEKLENFIPSVCQRHKRIIKIGCRRSKF